MTVRRADDKSYTLLDNASATGSGVVISGGQYMFQVKGTVGGSTASVQVKTVDGTWTNVFSYGVECKSTTLPFAASPLELPAGEVRAALTGGTPSAVYANLVGLG